jgi:hypothetical protein
LRAFAALIVAVALLMGLPGPAQAEFHTMAFGIGTTGSSEAQPGLSDTPQAQSMNLEFDAIGFGYFVPEVALTIAWDCRHDELTEGDRPVDQRDGFRLTSADGGETTAAGTGTMVGRCTGTTPELPGTVMVISCPIVIGMTYVRVGTIIQGAGLCLVSWGPQFPVGDVTITAVLQPTSEDNTTFSITAVAFRWRA